MFFRCEFFGNFWFLLQYSLVYIAPISIWYLYLMYMYVDNPWSLRLGMVTWNIQTNVDVFFWLLEYSIERATE